MIKLIQTIICILFIPAILYAEISITGTVTDLTSGYCIPNVAVTCSNGDGTHTNHKGIYVFENLGSGVFSFTFSKAGYETIIKTGIDAGNGQILNVQMAPPCILNIITEQLPPASVGVPYNPVVEVNCHTEPFVFELLSGQLPPGLTLQAESGNIAGIPSEAGAFSFQIGVTDAPGNYAAKALMIVVTNELAFKTNANLPYATLWQPYVFSFEAVNGLLPYEFSLIAGALPNGLFLSKNGQIGGGSTIVETFDSPLTSHWLRDGDIFPQITDKQRLTFGNLAQNQHSILRLNAHTTHNATLMFDYETQLDSQEDALIFRLDQVEIARFTNSQTRQFSLDGLSSGIHDFEWAFEKRSPNQTFSGAWLDDIQIQGMNAVPDQTGSADMTIRVVDQAGRTCTQNFHMQVLTPLRVDDMILQNGIVGKIYSQQLSETGGQLPVQWEIFYGHPPKGLEMDINSGELHGIPQETTYGTLVFAVEDHAGRMAFLDATLQVVAPLEIVSSQLPDGLAHERYSEAVITKGGMYPLTYLLAGEMPKGLSLNTRTGVIQGKPEITGVFNMEITVRDQNLPVPQSVTRQLHIKIQNSLTILSSAIFPRAQKHTEITPIILKAAGGQHPYTWEIKQGALPNGVSLDVHTGIISGIPADKGDASFDIQVCDQQGDCAQKSFIWYISDSLSIATTALADAVKDVLYEQVIQGQGGYPPYYWRIKSGALLSGLAFNNSTGVISGTPSNENEIRSFTVEISDSDSPAQKACRTFTMQVLPQALYIITSDLPLARVNQAYNQMIRASLGTPPYHWRIKSGVLPEGLVLIDDPNMARIQGKPLETGEFYFEIAVSDDSLPPAHAEKSLKLNVQGSVEIINDRLKPACSNQYYSDRIVAINGTLPYSFEIIDGQLPDNIHLNAHSGDITGISGLNPGTHAIFTIKVTDAGQPSASDKQLFYIYGQHCALTISPKSMPQGSVMMTYELSLQGKGGIAPYTFDLDSGQLPSGLSLSANGLIKGIPENQGNYHFMIRMRDAAGSLAQQAYAMTVVPCETCPMISGQTRHTNGGSMPNVPLTFRDASNYTRTTQTNETGEYEIKVPTGFSGAIMPQMEGYIFEPPNRMYQQIMTDHSRQDFVAQIIMLTISGKITDTDTGAGIPRVSIRYGDAGAFTMTDDQGTYDIQVPYGWTGTLIPENGGYRFEPSEIQIQNIREDQKNHHFSGISTYEPQVIVTPLSVIFQKPETARTTPNVQNETRRNSASYHTGLIIPESVKEYWQTHTPDDRYRKRRNLPSQLDWSQYDSPIRDQGRCGSCWAFAGVALLENLAIRAGLKISIDLSEQVMVSCVYKDRSSGGCSGGWYWDVFDYTFKHGIFEENCFPYKARNGNCDDQCESPEYRLRLTHFTPAHGLWEEDFTVQDLKGALQDGPLSVAFYVPASFFRYNGGIYDYQSGSMDFGHGVLLVGYDDANQCFKVKNSWGKNWGEDGYFRIAYNDTEDIKFGCYACLASGVYLENQGEVITIKNTGTGALKVHNITVDKNWLDFDPKTLAPVLPDNQCQLSIFVKDWSLISESKDQAIMTIHTNDALHPVVKIQVEALAQAQSLRPVLSVSPPFRDGVWIENQVIHIQTSGNGESIEFRISNAGTVTMNWTGETDSDWLIIEKGVSGINEGIMQMRCKPNHMKQAREGKLFITAEGAIKSPQVVQVYQSESALNLERIIFMLKVLCGMEISSEPVHISDVIAAKQAVCRH
jgi:C1A family cysteine protease